MNNERELWKQISELQRGLEKLKTIEVPPREVYLDVPLRSTSWDGDEDFSDVPASTKLDLSAVFGAPENIKRVYLLAITRDSAAWGTDGLYFTCGPSSTIYYEYICRPKGGDVVESAGPTWVPCDVNGDVWYRINASGVNTMNIWLEIWGYQK